MRKTGLRLSLLLLIGLLSACASLPRGAGLQREVLAVSTTEDGAAEFMVAPVTRPLLDRYAQWPAVGEDKLGWIERVRQPASRVIAPGDTVSVTIWNTEENGLLTAPGQRFVTLPELRVSAGGSIFLPYIGEQRIAGMSPERAREAIEERYYSVTPSAQVQFTLKEGRQNMVGLVGGVAAPGTYPLSDQDYTLLSLLAEGGGVQASLVNPQIRLQRGSRLYGISVDRLLENPALDTTLTGGDMVYVEEDERTFLSLGAAGQEAVHPFPQDEVTALEALAIVGGISDSRADPKGILILRRYPASAIRPGTAGPDNNRVVFTIDLTSADGLFSADQFLIRPGDLVYVTESPVTSAQTLFGLVGSAFGLARQASTVSG